MQIRGRGSKITKMFFDVICGLPPKELYGVFSNRTYDSLDPTDQSFIKDYEHFKSRTFELDREGFAFSNFLVQFNFSLQIFTLSHHVICKI